MPPVMTTLSKNPSWPLTASIRLFLIALVIAFLVVGRELLIPLTISVILTFILKPISSQLERWHFPKWLAILTSILLAFALLSAFVWFLYLQIQSFSDDLGQLKSAVSAKADAIQLFIREHFNVSKRAQSKWFDKKV